MYKSTPFLPPTCGMIFDCTPLVEMYNQSEIGEHLYISSRDA